MTLYSEIELKFTLTETHRNKYAIFLLLILVLHISHENEKKFKFNDHISKVKHSYFVRIGLRNRLNDLETEIKSNKSISYYTVEQEHLYISGRPTWVSDI